MKKFLGLFLTLLLLTGCVASAETVAPALTRDVVVLFTSDVHCGVDDGFGYAGLAAVRDQLAKTNHVLLVDNGDSIQGAPIGSMTTGEACVELMNAAGYDLAVPGNHEFDYGMDRFLELTERADFSYISANFVKDGAPVFAPYAIREFDGVKVAFVGVSTPKTITSSTPKYFQNEAGEFVYSFCQDETGEKLYAAVQSAVDAARAEGAQYVVALAHLGIEESCSPWMSSQVIANTVGIDALLDGHSHSVLAQEQVKNKEGADVLLAACGTKLANIGYLRIGANGKLSTGLYAWDNKISARALFGLTGAVAESVEKALADLNDTLNQVVATSTADLWTRDPETGARIIRNSETNLGDLCADAYRVMGNAQIGMVNGGGIRTDIKAGQITYGDIITLHPFGNSLCVVEATGQQILDALEWGARVTPGESGGFQHVSGLTYEIHTYIESSAQADENGMFAGVSGEYRVKNVKVAGEDLVLDQTYTLASHDYMLLNGGDGFNMFVNDPIQPFDLLIDNQVLIRYIETVLNGEIGQQYAEPYGEGRIVAVTEAPAQ